MCMTDLQMLCLGCTCCRARAELESLEAFKKKQNEYITPKMLYPQFLFALLYIAEKRRSGLQEVRRRRRAVRAAGRSGAEGAAGEAGAAGKAGTTSFYSTRQLARVLHKFYNHNSLCHFAGAAGCVAHLGEE